MDCSPRPRPARRSWTTRRGWRSTRGWACCSASWWPAWCTPARRPARPAANVATLGMGAPVLSTVEDGASLSLSLIALFVPCWWSSRSSRSLRRSAGWCGGEDRRVGPDGPLGGAARTRPVRDAAAVARRPGRRTDSRTVAPRTTCATAPADVRRRGRCARPVAKTRGDSSNRARGLTVRACSGRCCSPQAGHRGSGPSRKRPRRCARSSTGSSPGPISTPRYP